MTPMGGYRAPGAVHGCRRSTFGPMEEDTTKNEEDDDDDSLPEGLSIVGRSQIRWRDRLRRFEMARQKQA